MNISIIGGGGYVGLVTGLGFAELGHDVTCIDVDARKVEFLASGKSPIYERGIDDLLRRNLDAGRIRFTAHMDGAITGNDVVFVAVGTPSATDGHADLSQVIQVAEDISRCLRTPNSQLPTPNYTVIAIKSTVPVGTVELVRSILNRDHIEGTDFDVVSNPEFLQEGNAIYDFFSPDRIVIGSCSQRASETMRTLYRPFTGDEEKGRGGETKPTTSSPQPRALKRNVPLVETDLASAQMIKYACNAFLATRVSFINEIASLCERVGASVDEVVIGMGHDPRIGSSYLQAGVGFGGPCLDKDLRALIKLSETTGYEPQLLRAVSTRNEQQVEAIINKLKTLTGYLLYRKIVAVWGLAFKAGTNDVRNSPALKVIERLEEEGAVVQAYDPAANESAKAVHPSLNTFDDPYATVRHADALLVLTDWPQFAAVDFERLKGVMAVPIIIDGRNVLERGMAGQAGFKYVRVGSA